MISSGKNILPLLGGVAVSRENMAAITNAKPNVRGALPSLGGHAATDINTRSVNSSPIAKSSTPNSVANIGTSAVSKSIKSTLTPDAQGNIHEEELQHALVAFMLGDISPQAGAKYKEIFGQLIGSGNPPLLTEDAVKVALKKLVELKLVTAEQAEKINGRSFAAAQLDSDTSTLFDNRGGPGDNTIAVMSIDDAIAKAESAIQAIENGTNKVESRSLSAPSNIAPSSHSGNVNSGVGSHSASSSISTSSSPSGGGSAGFLWKPVSESNGKLVVLLPASLSGKIESTALYASDGTLIEKGNYSGVANGGRAHFRFSKPGSGYPAGTVVVAQLSDGTKKEFSVRSTGSRQEGS